jgi:hypothetical protein
MARFGKNTVQEAAQSLGIPTDADIEEWGKDHSETIYDAPYDPDVDHPVDAPAQEVPGMTNIIDDKPATPAAEVPEVPAHDAEATGAKTRRGRPKMGELPEVTLDDLPDAVEVPESEWESAPLDEKKVIERSAAQMKIDAAVKLVYDKWVEKDKPPARTAPRMSYEVKPELAQTTSAMVTRAGVFHKVRVVKSVTHTPQGMARITFSAIDRPPVTKKTEK